MRRTLLAVVAAAVLAGPSAADEEACYGTKINFKDTPKLAAAAAKDREKLVFILHVSGHFEDPRFT
jgi:hypothetical protein